MTVLGPTLSSSLLSRKLGKTSNTEALLLHLLQVICLPAGPNAQRLHSSRCWAFFLSFLYPFSITQSMSFCLGRTLALFHSILSFIISLCRMCPIQFFCLSIVLS